MLMHTLRTTLFAAGSMILAGGGALPGTEDHGHAHGEGRSGDVVASLLREAYRESPEIKAAHARWAAALERVPQAGALPDPRVSYGYFIERMETRQIFRIEQMFPGYGKRRLRSGVAEEEARAVEDALSGTLADVRRDLFMALSEWILAEESVHLVEGNLALVEQLVQVARQRYRTGETSRADVIRLEAEADALRVELESWREREPATRSGVNAIIGRDPDAPLPKVSALAEAFAGEPRDPAALVLEENPDLRQRRSRIRGADRARELARAETRPTHPFV